MLRRCGSVHARLDLQCQGEVIYDSVHIEDHYAQRADGVTIRWAQGGLADSLGPGELTRGDGEPAPGSAPASERQVGGEHYRQTAIQPWDIIDDHGLDFYRGNALKYLLRAGRKGPAVQDLRKAIHYIEKYIEIEEGGQ